MEDDRTMDFSHIKYTEVSPLAESLFNIEGVIRVFYGKDFISVTKDDSIEWPFLRPEILMTIRDHYSSGNLLLLPHVDYLPPTDTAI